MLSVKEKVTGFFKKSSVKVATVTTAVMVSSSAMAGTTSIDVTPVVTALEGLMTPIASVGAAWLSVQVAIRGWKIVRALI